MRRFFTGMKGMEGIRIYLHITFILVESICTHFFERGFGGSGGLRRISF